MVRGGCDNQRRVRDVSSYFEDGGEGVSQGRYVASKRWKRQENRLSPGASRRKHSPADTVILAQENSYLISILQNGKTIHFSCVNLL